MMLGAIDRQWIDYLTAMDELRQSISLQAFAQKDPLVEFKRQSFQMFDQLKANITRDIVYNIMGASFQYEAYVRQIEAEQQRRLATAQTVGGSSEAEQERAKPQRSKSAGLPGRNDPCPCGSGKKFKNCHMGREDEIRHLLSGQGGGSGRPTPSPSAVAQRLPGAAAAAAREAAIAAEAEKIRQATAAQANGPAQPQVQRGRAAPAVPRGKKK